jgi:hypothetical protein
MIKVESLENGNISVTLKGRMDDCIIELASAFLELKMDLAKDGESLELEEFKRITKETYKVYDDFTKEEVVNESNPSE